MTKTRTKCEKGLNFAPSDESMNDDAFLADAVRSGVLTPPTPGPVAPLDEILGELGD
ncbi:MAG: hypothetical protein J4F40_19845 [Alphaproteobacteria bacterium]|nr:hypothetical protein [Alphaproteobacteria bacterium]MCY4498877.1 hypothetical protein [Rhodospirillaceae bacterium]